tara:strand:+ start:336 stop:560 length:225 start_codon:yes stop_codon:yes gene_type:complete
VREREIGVFLVRSLGLEACMQGKTLTGWVSFGGIIFLVSPNRGRETTHQKEAKMIECFPEKERKQEKEKEMSKL